jgi:uncharacterized membrane protein affecting hemolysin expression
MSDIKQQFEKVESEFSRVLNFISKHRTVIVIFIACSAVILAVLQTQNYLNPDRNEDKYLETKSSLTIRELDQSIIEKLEKTQSDIENTADSNFVTDRTNPFAE